MPRVLLATDSDRIHEDIDAAIAGDDIELFRVREGVEVPLVAAEMEPDLVILDLQIGNMGGMATCVSLRLDESVDRLPHIQVLMLLDREADIFLAERCDADGWVVKPLDAFRVRRAVAALLQGGRWTEGRTEDPAPASA